MPEMVTPVVVTFSRSTTRLGLLAYLLLRRSDDSRVEVGKRLCLPVRTVLILSESAWHGLHSQ